MAHVLAKDLREAVLQAALSGKLTNTHVGDTDVFRNDLNTFDSNEYSVPDAWKLCKIGDLVNIKNGFTPSRSKVEYWNSMDIPWFTVDDIKAQGHVITNTIQYISSKAIGSKKRIVKEDTVLLCCTSATIGNYALSKIPLTTNQQWNGLEIKECYTHLLLPSYIYVWVQTLKPKMISIAGSTTFPFLSVKKLSDFFIPLPPIEEQARIVAKVDEIMAKIDEYEKLENQLVKLKEQFPKDIKESLFQFAMQGDLTNRLSSDSNVADFLSNISETKNTLLKNKKIKKDKTQPINYDELPFDIPDEWQWSKLGMLANLRTGKTPPRSESIWWGKENDIPWVSIGDMKENGFINTTKEFISKKGFDEKFNKTISPKGTLIMSFKLTIGRVSILDMDALHNEAIISIFPYVDEHRILQKYLFKVLPYLVKYGDSKNAIKGSTLNSDSLCNLYIPLPSIEEQQRIVDKLDELLPLVDKLAELN